MQMRIESDKESVVQLYFFCIVEIKILLLIRN